MITKSREFEIGPHRHVQSAALVVSLALSAYLISVALASPKYHWLCWIGFLPLFAVVRSLRPLPAALAGGLWGVCLYLFLTAGAAPEVDAVSAGIAPSGRLLVLYIVIPTVYVGLAARPAWAIGFKLLTLALGWTLVEVVLHLSNTYGPYDGLLTRSQGEGPQFHWLARLFAFVAAALLVACANASLVGLVILARLSFPVWKLPVGAPNAGACARSHVFLAIAVWTLRHLHPRAPPKMVVVRC